MSSPTTIFSEMFLQADNPKKDPLHILDKDGKVIGWIDSNGVLQGTLAGSGGTSAVVSVFGRAGAIIAQSNDYSFSQITGILAAAQIPFVNASAQTYNVLAYGAFGNTRKIANQTCSIASNGQGAFTLTATNSTFVASDVGKQVDGWNVSAGGQFLNRRTITAFIDNTHVTVDGNGTGTSGSTGTVLIIGNDDTTGIAAAVTALVASGQPGVLYFPAGGYMNFQPILGASTPAGSSVQGAGCGQLTKGSATTIYLTADFSWSTTTAQLFQILSVSDLTIDGLGVITNTPTQPIIQGAGVLRDVAFNNFTAANVNGGIFPNSDFNCAVVRYRSNGVSCAGQCLQFACQGGCIIEPMITSGNIGVQDWAQSIIGGFIGGTVTVQGSSGAPNGLTICGTRIAKLAVNTNGSAILLGGSCGVAVSGKTNNIPGGTNATGISIDNTSTVIASSCYISGSGNIAAIVNAGTFIDAGGNQMILVQGAAASSGAGNFAGGLSVTGALAAAGNITPDTGWGTTGGAGNGVSAVNGNTRIIQFTITATGSPTSSPQVAITFPASLWPFLAAPICNIRQVGGTFGEVTNPIISSGPTTSGVTFTFGGTPVSGHSYTFQVSSDTP